MTTSRTIQDDMCLKLRAVGVPKEILYPMVNQLMHQIRSEGPENVVKRLKVLKQAAVSYIAGQEVFFPWIKHTRHGPKGPWRPVWRWLQSQKYRVKMRALNTMMVYANLVLPRSSGPTPTQERKFLLSVVHSPELLQQKTTKYEKSTIEMGCISEGIKFLGRYLEAKGWTPDTSRIPFVVDYMVQRYGAEPKAVAKSQVAIESFLGQERFYPFHSFPQVLETLDYLGQDSFDMTHPWNGAYRNWQEQEPPDQEIGVIGFTHEPGYKFRAFAAPNRVLQAAAQGLKLCLLDALRLCDWDNTHDQEQGVAVVQSWLKEGRTLFSVDLSDATNNFPLTLQLEVLERLGIPQQDRSLLEVVSRSPFKKMWGDETLVSWNWGQPLGYAPSFMVFALAHAATALGAEVMAGVPRKDLGSHFRILGDDIIFDDEEVHVQYRRLIGALGCPVSEAKCLQSTVAGEFAGKLITVDHVFHGYKYRAISDLSFMDVIRNLGKSAVTLLTSEQRAYVELVHDLPEPFGLGWNPRGIPLEDRWYVYLRVKEALDRLQPDTKVYRVHELRDQYFYGLPRRSRWVWYFPEHSDLPDQTHNGGVSPDREEVLKWIKNTSTLVSSAVSVGDPRGNPIKLWSENVSRLVLPMVQRERDKCEAIRALRNGQACSPEPAYFGGLNNGETPCSVTGT